MDGNGIRDEPPPNNTSEPVLQDLVLYGGFKIPNHSNTTLYVSKTRLDQHDSVDHMQPQARQTHDSRRQGEAGGC